MEENLEMLSDTYLNLGQKKKGRKITERGALIFTGDVRVASYERACRQCTLKEPVIVMVL